MTTTLSIFDHVFVINRDRDGVRLARMTRRLGRLGVPFERFAALPPPADRPLLMPLGMRAGALGCARSHLEALRLGVARGYERFLVLEDDCILRDDVADRMRELAVELDSVPWDVFHLGALVLEGARAADHLVTVKSGGHLHAYGVNAGGAAKMIAHCERFLAQRPFKLEFVDWFYATDIRRVAAMPLLAIQENNLSASDGRFNLRFGEYFCPGTLSEGGWPEFKSRCAETRTPRWRVYEALRAAQIVLGAPAHHMRALLRGASGAR